MRESTIAVIRRLRRQTGLWPRSDQVAQWQGKPEYEVRARLNRLVDRGLIWVDVDRRYHADYMPPITGTVGVADIETL